MVQCSIYNIYNTLSFNNKKQNANVPYHLRRLTLLQSPLDVTLFAGELFVYVGLLALQLRELREVLVAPHECLYLHL